MKCVIGLGNPGKEYAYTRHNIGYTAVSALAKTLGLEWKKEKKLFGEMAKNQKVALLKPGTFMNESGRSVSAAKKIFNCINNDLIIVHDDLDLPLFKYKIQKNRGSAGHNGVESIIAALKTKDFWRLRIGIDKPKMKSKGKDYVLGQFSKTEAGGLNTALDQITKVLQNWIL